MLRGTSLSVPAGQPFSSDLGKIFPLIFPGQGPEKCRDFHGFLFAQCTDRRQLEFPREILIDVGQPRVQSFIFYLLRQDRRREYGFTEYYTDSAEEENITSIPNNAAL